MTSVPPPSEPDWRISRIRLSSWWFTSERIDRPIDRQFRMHGRVGQETVPASKALIVNMPMSADSQMDSGHVCRNRVPGLSPERTLSLGCWLVSVPVVIHLPASLRSPGVTRLQRYYGRSDS